MTMTMHSHSPCITRAVRILDRSCHLLRRAGCNSLTAKGSFTASFGWRGGVSPTLGCSAIFWLSWPVISAQVQTKWYHVSRDAQSLKWRAQKQETGLSRLRLKIQSRSLLEDASQLLHRVKLLLGLRSLGQRLIDRMEHERSKLGESSKAVLPTNSGA